VEETALVRKVNIAFSFIGTANDECLLATLSELMFFPGS
jgi:hypothetical protein